MQSLESGTVGDFVAIIPFAIALLLPFAKLTSAPPFPGEALVLTLSTVVRILLCVLSASGIFLPPVSDSLDFHTEAVAFADGSQSFLLDRPGSQIYTAYLSIFYSAFGPSILLADSIGVLVMSLVGLAFLSLARRVVGHRSVALPLTLVLLGPASLLYANFNYREPYQLLFMLMAVLAADRYRESASIIQLFIATAWLALFSIIHNKFFLLTPIVLIATVFIPGANTRGGWIRFLPGTMLAIGSTAVFALWLGSSMQDVDVVKAVTSGTVGTYLEEFGTVAGQVGGRTTMPYYPTGQGPVDTFLLLPLLLFQFTFAPLLPWLVTEAQDLVALADAVMRAVALFATFRFLRTVRGPKWWQAVFLVAVFFSCSALASLGTWTVGAAIRHQLKASWIILLLSYQSLSRWIALSARSPA